MLFLSSGDASDSICPKGWGMAGVDEDGSYQRLFVNIYGMNKATKSFARIYREYNDANPVRMDEFSQQLIFLYSRSGWYHINNNTRYDGGWTGIYWGNKANDNEAYNFSFSSTYLAPQKSNYKKQGSSLRCVAK